MDNKSKFIIIIKNHSYDLKFKFLNDNINKFYINRLR